MGQAGYYDVDLTNIEKDHSVWYMKRQEMKWNSVSYNM